MTRAVRSALALVFALSWTLPFRVSAQTATPIPFIAIDDPTGAAAARLLETAGTLSFPVAARVTLRPGDTMAAIDARLAVLDRRHTPIWLVTPIPSSVDAVAEWRTLLRHVVEGHRDAVRLVELEIDQQPADLARFAIQSAATEIRSTSALTRIGAGGPAMSDRSRREAIYRADLTPYADVLVVSSDRADAVEAWLATIDPQASLAFGPAGPASSGQADLIDAALESLGTKVVTRAWPAASITVARLRALSRLGPLLTHQVAVLADESVNLRILAAGTDVTEQIRHRLLFDTDSYSTYLAYWTDRQGPPLEIQLTLSMQGTPAATDLGTGARLRVADYSRDTATGRVRVQVARPSQVAVVNFNEDALPIADRSDVSAERVLTVREIIARHQQQQATQDDLVKNYIAHMRMEQHFRPTVADPGYDVVSENRVFSASDGIEWEELSFSVNGSKWGADRPPFPILQPEKALALPLQLKFDEGYQYRLRDRERVDGFDCYVVDFEPERDDSALYRGTVWIDRRTFARIRVHAVRGGLSAPIVSNDEDQRFAPIARVGAEPVFLLTDLVAKQILLVAGRNLLLEKRSSFTDFRVNDGEFWRERESARVSDRVMFRETAGGLRYFMKESGQRVISDRPTLGVRAMAMGVMLDPSYTFPLPIFGINYIDFQFGHPDSQLALLFAGVLAAGNIQRSNFGAKSVDASLDFFAIAAPSSDRVFGMGTEDPAVRLLTWPMSTGVNVGWQATPFLKATIQYQFRFDAFVRDRTTSEAFIVPSSTVTNGIGGAWEYRRGGYSITANATRFVRAAWKPWGEGDTTSRSYTKYSVGASRDVFLGPFQKLHFNGAWFGGRDLDRFGKYQFGMFDDTRIHGVPASGIRFGELGMVRGSYSLNIFEQYRVDLFLEHAWGRDEPSTGAWQSLPGIGVALNLRGPWNTIVRVDAGKSFLPRQYGNLGSTTLQVMLLKPLR